ncbi:phospholipid carrier-dependent glycosyltransferase [Candidatus Sumerlaeota bacterium]|nr:phospholipid carrier-dependent glycosyltransferase [Candidatus Sumerlaeota bacterium]
MANKGKVIILSGVVLIVVFLLASGFFALRDKDPVIGGIFLSPERIKFLILTFLSVFVVSISCFSLGLLIWDIFRFPELDNLQLAIFRSGLGCAGFFLVLMMYAAIGVFQPLFLHPLVLISVYPIFRYTRRHHIKHNQLQQQCSPTPAVNHYLVRSVFIVLSTVVLFPVFISSLLPPNHWDELVYQLTIPKKYLATHRFVYLPFLLYINTPHYLNLLYGWLMSFGSDVAPRMFHFLMGIATALLIWSLCVGYWDKLTAYIAVIIFLATPLMAMEMSTALVDIGLAYFFILAFVALLHWRDSGAKEKKWLILAGIFAGAQLGCKYQGIYGVLSLTLLLLIILFIEFLMPCRITFSSALATVFYFIIPVIVLILPWLIKNLIMVHNPVYPNLYSVFGGKYWANEHSIQMKKWLGSMGMGHSVVDFFLLFWRLPMKGWYLYSHFAGILTPFYFLPLPLLLIVKKPSRTTFYLLITAIVFLISWFLGSQQVRFLIPGLTLFAILSGVAISRPLQRYAHQLSHLTEGFVIVVLVVITATGIFAEPKDFILLGKRMAVIFDHADTDTYLIKECGIDNQRMINFINRTLPPDARILMLFDNRGYYLERDYIAEGTFEVSRICAIFAKAKSPEDLYKFWRERGVTHVLFNRTYWRGYSGDFIRNFYPDFEKKFNQFIEKYLQLLKEMNGIMLYELKGK